MGRPSLVQILLAAICVYAVAQGWVQLNILLFPILGSLYIFLMSKYIVPPLTTKLAPGLFQGSKLSPQTTKLAPGLFEGSELLMRYVLFAALIGLLLPFVYIVCAFVQGDLIALQQAVPALFLLICQVLTENYTYGRASFSVLIRALVPILYNTRRLFDIWSWTVFVFGLKGGGGKPEHSTSGLTLFGQVVAVANVVLWNCNLFGFLLPVFLLRSMRQYYDLEQKQRSR